MIIKPTISFLNRQPDADLQGQVGIILRSMQDNPAYPAPVPPLAEVQTALDEYTVADASAHDGGKALTSAKNASRKALVLLVRALACYVQVACNGNLSVLQTSGFPTHKTARSPLGTLPMPAELQVAHGLRTGELDARVAPVYGALMYNWRVTDPAGVLVQTAQTSSASTTFGNLTPGVIYAVTANCAGSTGASNWTGPISRMAV